MNHNALHRKLTDCLDQLIHMDEQGELLPPNYVESKQPDTHKDTYNQLIAELQPFISKSMDRETKADIARRTGYSRPGVQVHLTTLRKAAGVKMAGKHFRKRVK